jgi:hypothetical protein
VYLTGQATIQALEERHAQAGQNFVWSPVGRAGWDSTTRNIILSELETPEMGERVRKAGFAAGDKRHFDLCLESMRRMMNRMQWEF